MIENYHNISIVITLIVVTALPLSKNYFSQKLCLFSQGKWVSNGNYCIQRDCAKDNSCLPSYNNHTICKSIQIGISENELYFNLGMPITDNNSTLTFVGGSDKPNITATIQKHKVVHLKCE